MFNQTREWQKKVTFSFSLFPCGYQVIITQLNALVYIIRTLVKVHQNVRNQRGKQRQTKISCRKAIYKSEIRYALHSRIMCCNTRTLVCIFRAFAVLWNYNPNQIRDAHKILLLLLKTVTYKKKSTRTHKIRRAYKSHSDSISGSPLNIAITPTCP